MTFTYDGADLSKIIARYKKDGYNYHIEYLDSTTQDYVSYNEDEEYNIINKMVEQAIDRKNNFNYNGEKSEKYTNLSLSILSQLLSLHYYSNQKNILSTFLFITSILYLNYCIENNQDLKELKKYEMFLEMTKDNPCKGLDSKWLDYIEFERIYQTPMKINTLDNYNYSDVKYIYKKFNSKRNNNKHGE